MAIRTLIVDDEEAARDRLQQLLGRLADLEIVGTAEDGDEALDLIRALNPDVVFLDIEMPGKTGIQVAAHLPPPRPQIIYCTAYDQFAVEAFEQHALDYLLKPVSRVRLAKAVDRVRQSLKENAWQNEELKPAERTQARLFPQSLPQLQTLEYTGFCRPARGVGGDYYDFLALGHDQLGVALADVSGKGVAGALLMAGLQGRLQSRAYENPERIDEMISELNDSMYESTDSGKFVTLFYGVYDDESRVFRYVNAGHNPPIWLKRESDGTHSVDHLEAGGMVVGAFPRVGFEQGQLTLGSGETILVFTDGLTEAMDSAEEEFGEERLLELVQANPDRPVNDLAKLIEETVMDFVEPGSLHDDLTLIVARGV
jgi:sigma-B regulation protein RsbU (phosphoserine phosphatase)